MLKDFPFNRLSIGVQSFLDKELETINRRHSARQAMEAIHEACRQGFGNISLDLMYGLPGQTLESFRFSIEAALSLPVTHISSYALSWEEGSVLFRKREQGLLVQSSDELLEACYFELIRMLELSGFSQYELSNFSRPGIESKHNSSYWSGMPYLGFGPGAHSYNGTERRMNVRSIGRYMSGIREGKPSREVEMLDKQSRYNDFIITRLRTVKGLDLSELALLFGRKMRVYCLDNAARSIKNGFLIRQEEYLRLLPKGYFIADNILSDLLQVED
jgi:oxygen-independent coproporphyrinogen-3 oxidase